MSSQALTVNFHGAELFVVEHEGQPYTPMKQIVEGMGLDWSSQLAKLNANKQRWGMVKIAIPTISNIQEAVCMPLRKLAGWLSTIHPNKVKPELRDTIIAYQNECDDVLWAHWSKQNIQQPSIPIAPERKTKKAIPGCLTLDQQDTIKELVKKNVEHLPIEKQAGQIIKQWSAIKQKFGCSYKEIPQSEYINIISLLTRLPIEGEVIQKKPNTITIQREGKAITVKDTDPRDYDDARKHLENIKQAAQVSIDDSLFGLVLTEIENLENCLIRGWTAMDEAIISLGHASAVLRLWRNK